MQNRSIRKITIRIQRPKKSLSGSATLNITEFKLFTPKKYIRNFIQKKCPKHSQFKISIWCNHRQAKRVDHPETIAK